jgi:transcriptional regulator with XRE-family HTH domain
MIFDDIANNLKRLRENSGLTQREAGVQLGFSQETAQARIHQYESGRRSPGKNTLFKFSVLYGVPVSLILQQTSEGGPDITAIGKQKSLQNMQARAKLLPKDVKDLHSLESILSFISDFYEHKQGDEIVWFEVQFQRSFPEYLIWKEKT